jgi:hypothetical protein
MLSLQMTHEGNHSDTASSLRPPYRGPVCDVYDMGLMARPGATRQSSEGARLDGVRTPQWPRRRAGSSGGKRPGANGARSTWRGAPSRISSLMASPVAGALSMPHTRHVRTVNTRDSADEGKTVFADGPEARLPRFDRRRGEHWRDIPTQRFEPRVRTLISRNIGRIDRQRPSA